MNEACKFPFDKLPRLGAFPLPIYQWAVNEVIRAHKVPSKLAHYSAVAAACALAQMHVDVHKPAGGIVPTSVYILLQGKSGERKTKVDECFFGELRKPSKIHRKQYLDEIDAHKVRLRIWKRKERVLMDALGRAYDDGKDTSALELEIIKHGMSKPDEPKEMKLIFSDTTIAALKNKLAESPNGTLLSSDGKKVLNDLILQNDADVNQLWSGEGIDIQRVEARSYMLDGVRFTFCVMVQNDSLSRIMLDKGEKAKESGFFARIIFSDVGSTIGERLIDIIETAIPDLEEYNKRITTLLTEYVEATAAGSYRRRTLKFGAESSRAWIAYFNYVESNIRAGGRYEKTGDHASKLADNVARIAAGLHVLEGFEGEIGLDCLLCAIVLCDEASKDYLEHLASKDEDEIEAVAFKDWLVQKYVSKRTSWIEVNRLLQFAPNRMRSAKRIHRYLEILERDEYLVVWPPGSGGRKMAQVEFRMSRGGVAWSKAPSLQELSSLRTEYT
ncbi:MAG: DUF3987 domain-containing protein [Pseudoxanthomonas mexicana]|nr:DUF3987 domain-containing protein [Pseudoxanthomonas mexicana]